MSKTEFRAATKEFVQRALSQAEGRQPSQARVNQVVSRIVKAMEPVVLKKSR